MAAPSDLEAEESVLGACLLSVHATEIVLGILAPGDFYKPSHAAIFGAIQFLYDHGQAIDTVTVKAQLGAMGDDVVTAADLLSIQSNVPSISSATRYAMIIARHSLARNGVRISSEALNAFQDPTTDIGQYIDTLQAELKGLDSPYLEKPLEYIDWDDFLSRPETERKPWVVEGLLREDWRAMFVGREGSGKSVLIQSIGVCAGFGVHPLSPRKMTAAQVLIVDLENPADVLHDRIKWASDACKTLSYHETDRHSYIYHKPGGINLRRRTDRLAFEDVIKRTQPNLVVFGPIYKSYHRMSNESDEQVASEVQDVLDDLRSRYGFALLMEHHAAKGAQEGKRDLIPFGSSLWLRWSELGYSLVPDTPEFPDKHLNLVSYRGDRVNNAWPKSVEWGSLHNSPFPWKGIWDD